jgi:hypothetical protein
MSKLTDQRVLRGTVKSFQNMYGFLLVPGMSDIKIDLNRGSFIEVSAEGVNFVGPTKDIRGVTVTVTSPMAGVRLVCIADSKSDGRLYAVTWAYEWDYDAALREYHTQYSPQDMSALEAGDFN